MTVEFKIEDLDFGWSRMKISNSQSQYEFEFSDLDSFIEELLNAMQDLKQCGSGKDFRIVFPGEPGQNVLYLVSHNKSDVEVKVTSSIEWEKIAKAYGREVEEEMIYLDGHETKENLMRIVIDSIVNYVRSSNTSDKAELEKWLGKILR